MDLDFTPAQCAFRDEVRHFIDAMVPPAIRERLQNGYLPRRDDVVAVQRALHTRGWAAPHWPRRYGGAELGQAERLLLASELQRACVPLPHSINVVMLGPVLIEYGTEAQRAFFLPKLASLDLWFCQGFSEPEAGSDLASLQTRAERVGDHYIVRGCKTWTTSAHWADWIFCLVRTGGGTTRQQGISFLLIDLRSPGVSVRPIITIDGAHHLNEVRFDGVAVPVANRVGDEGQGWSCAKFLLGNERTNIANVGYLQERLRAARALASMRVRRGRRLIDEPAVRAELAVLDAEVRSLEVSNWRYLLGPPIATVGAAYASLLKLQGSALLQRLAVLNARLIGPGAAEQRSYAGEAELHPEAAALPRVLISRAASIYGGTSEVQLDLLARAALG